MNGNTSAPLKDQKGKPNLLLEVGNTEKQLWALIHSKGLLCVDVKELCRRVCSSYERIILGDYNVAELQDVEYSLWKLHYRHIDEFRRRIRSSGNSDSNNFGVPQSGAKVAEVNDNHVIGFREFLSESIEFYQKLMIRLRKYCGCSDDCSFYGAGALEPKKLIKCQFLCHRFLVCLGDLARYKEQHERFGAPEHNWSVAATHYLEATVVWPDSGNPQNQLAVLATYVGDEFLALYHCIRSLAVKEPFPDAWNNLLLLFERNRSSNLHSLSNKAHFDFLKPSERSNFQNNNLNSKMLKAECDSFMESNLWSLIIRTVGFFFIKSRLEEFPCAFASTVRELDELMALDDTKLKPMLESYQHMDLARTGPFRALQVVSIFIFIIHNLISKQEPKRSEDYNDRQRQIELTRLAFTVTFIFMGRFLERCLQSKPFDSCPLLPAVLVFVEWLVDVLDEAEKHREDDKSNSAMSYFFAAFVGLLKQLNPTFEASSPEKTALWEDYELRGFAPVSFPQESLSFSNQCGQMKSFESGSRCRINRIINAAVKIANKSHGSQKWMLYEKSGRGFYVAEKDLNSDGSKSGGELIGDCQRKDSKENDKQIPVEEEEVIVFKPLMRYNSAPLSSTNTKDAESSLKDVEEQTLPPEERLRRATSLLIARERSQGNDPSALDSDISNFHPSKPYHNKQKEALGKDTGLDPFSPSPISSGPPSLNAWVFDQESVENGEKSGSKMSKPGLSTIEEIPSSSMSSLSIGQTEESAIYSDELHPSGCHSLPYSVPEPSAPLLPDNGTWFDTVQPSFSDFSYPNWSYGSATPIFSDRYPPFTAMSSSEWLRQYRETHSLNPPLNSYAPRIAGGFYGQDASRFYPFVPWQPPLATNHTMYTESPPLIPVLPQLHIADEQRRDTKLFHGYQQPIHYGCGAVTELRDEPQPLLQYLKEKELFLQRDPTFRGPTTYTGK